MNLVIVDDEPGALLTLRTLVERTCPNVRVVGEAYTALEGIKVIQREQPHVVLLDIEMPHGSGFELLDAFPMRTFQVVFVTAHEQHAVQAAHTHPYDYLLKPVDPDELKRVFDQLHAAHGRNGAKRIGISSVNGKLFIPVEDIVRIEADGGYSTVHTQQGEKHVASKSIGYFEELLPKEVFFRCHHSHLLNLTFVKGYLNQDGGVAQLRDGAIVPIASRRHAAFLERFEEPSRPSK